MGKEIGAIEEYCRLVCRLAANLMEAVERMELDERMSEEALAVYPLALQLAQLEVGSAEERLATPSRCGC